MHENSQNLPPAPESESAEKLLQLIQEGRFNDLKLMQRLHEALEKAIKLRQQEGGSPEKQPVETSTDATPKEISNSILLFLANGGRPDKELHFGIFHFNNGDIKQDERHAQMAANFITKHMSSMTPKDVNSLFNYLNDFPLHAGGGTNGVYNTMIPGFAELRKQLCIYLTRLQFENSSEFLRIFARLFMRAGPYNDEIVSIYEILYVRNTNQQASLAAFNKAQTILKKYLASF